MKKANTVIERKPRLEISLTKNQKKKIKDKAKKEKRSISALVLGKYFE